MGSWFAKGTSPRWSGDVPRVLHWYGGVQWQWLSRGSSNEGASWVCRCFLPLFFFGHFLIQPIVHVLLALVVLLLYPKTFLWKGFLIHGRNPADDWFYIRNTQILWHHRPDRCLQIFVYWHQLTCFSQDHAFRTDHLVSGMYSMSCVFWYNIQVTSIYTTFKTTFPMQVFFTEWLPLSMDSQRKKTCGANRSSWNECRWHPGGIQAASKHGSSNPHDFNPSKRDRSW